MLDPQFRSLGSVLLLALALGLPRVAPAQEQDAGAEDADAFRKQIVSEWGWAPNHGVALTTIAYARDYVEKQYISKDGRFPKQWDARDMPGAAVSFQNFDELPIVLFQTAKFDFIVLDSTRLKPAPRDSKTDTFVVVNRESGSIVAENLKYPPCERTQSFVELDGAVPFEVKQDTSCMTAGSGGGFSVKVYRADKALIVLMLSLLLPVHAFAQQKASDSKARYQEVFRQWVVKSFHWRPGIGVGLTTTEYARKYLERYKEVSDESLEDSLSGVFTGGDDLVVLFQTATLDIVVAYDPQEWAVEEIQGDLREMGASYLIIDRASKAVREAGLELGRSHSPGQRLRFVEVTGKKPAELQRQFYPGSTGTGIRSSESFSLEALDQHDLNTLFELKLKDSVGPNVCPGIQLRNANAEDVSVPIAEMSMKGESLVATSNMTFFLRPVLQVSHRVDYCQEVGSVPILRRECTYEAAKDKFVCSDKPVQRVELTASELLNLNELKARKDDFRWIIANQQRLRELVYDISSKSVERLRRELTQGK